MKVLWPYQDKLNEFINGSQLRAEYYESLRLAIESNVHICGLDIDRWKAEMHRWAIKRREEILCEYVPIDNNTIEIRVKGHEAIIYFTITK